MGTGNKKTGQSDFSESVKNSLEKMNEKKPKAVDIKKEAVGIIPFVQASRPQMLTIYNHIHSIGADNHILVGDSKEKNRMILQKWFYTLVLNNQRFPTDIPIEFVLDEFFNAILQQRVTLKGFNLLAHMEAFHEYIDNFRHELKGKWWAHQNPDQRPMELPEAGSYSEVDQQASEQERSEAIKKMYKDNIPESLNKYIIDDQQDSPDEENTKQTP